MAFGPGKYDDMCTHVRETTNAQGVLLLVMNGNAGTGFSLQGPMHLQLSLPDALEQMARQIRADWAQGFGAGGGEGSPP